MADLWKQTFGAQGQVDVAEPPPGIPRLFWEKLLQDPANQNGLKWLSDPTAKGGFDRFPTKDSYLAFLQQAATEQFQRLPKAQQQEYVDADAAGNKYSPRSIEGLLERQEKQDASNAALGQADYAGLEAMMPELEQSYRAAASGDQAALEHLNEILSGIKDPAIKDYVGDYAAHLASPDQRDVDAQRRQLAKLETLSDPTMSAEEKLMYEMARRQTESDLKGQRGAIKNDLQARGVYGSGAELTMNLAAQQEAAQRQALELMAANANASKRAMDSLKGAADLSSSMRGSSAQESQYNAGAMDLADQFNKKLREGYQTWKDKTEKENIDRQIGREEKIAGNVGKIGQAGVGMVSDILGARGKLADTKHNIRKEGADAFRTTNDRWIDRGAQEEGEEKLDL